MEGVEIGSGIYRLELRPLGSLLLAVILLFMTTNFKYSQPLNTSVTLSCWVQVNLTESRFRSFRNKNLPTTSVQKFFTQVMSQLVISGHFPNFDNLLFISYYSPITIHHCTIHHF